MVCQRPKDGNGSLNIHQVRSLYGPYGPYVLGTIGTLALKPRTKRQWRKYSVIGELPSAAEFRHRLHSMFLDSIDGHLKDAIRSLLQLHGEMDEWVRMVPDRLHGPAEKLATDIRAAIEETLLEIHKIGDDGPSYQISYVPPVEFLEVQPPTRISRHNAVLAQLESLQEVLDFRIPDSFASIKEYPKQYLTR